MSEEPALTRKYTSFAEMWADFTAAKAQLEAFLKNGAAHYSLSEEEYSAHLVRIHDQEQRCRLMLFRFALKGLAPERNSEVARA